MKDIIENKNNQNVLGGGTPKLRDSNLELFRIITMLLIVAHHYVVNSGLMERVYQDPLAPRSLFLLVFGAWGKTGINCFLMITGYFMCKSKITARKFIKLLAEVYFYRIIFYSVFAAMGYESLSIKHLIMLLLPVEAIQQTFTGCYLVFFLCIPFLNILIQNMTEKQHIHLIIWVSFIYIFLGTIPITNVTMNYVSWYIVLYFIASYFRMYPRPLFENTKFWGWMAAVSFVISLVSIIVCTWLGTKIGKQIPFYFVSDSNKILAVLTAISAFLFFKNVKIEYSKIINAVAASTFGVLQIHANSDAMRRWLWQDLLNNVGMYESNWLVLHAFSSVIGVFVICTAIDYLRIRLIEVPVERYWRMDSCR